MARLLTLLVEIPLHPIQVESEVFSHLDPREAGARYPKIYCVHGDGIEGRKLMRGEGFNRNYSGVTFRESHGTRLSSYVGCESTKVALEHSRISEARASFASLPIPSS